VQQQLKVCILVGPLIFGVRNQGSDVLDTSWITQGAANEVPEEFAVDEAPESSPDAI